jgi:Tannase and feruloyl esterase
VGAERGGWNRSIVGTPNVGKLYAESFMQSFGLQPAPGPSWSSSQFDWDRDPPKLAKTAALVDAVNPDLSAIQRKGGRILQYHGWADTLVTPYGSIDYYQSVLQKMGPTVKDFYRLYMVPGMAHCAGGDGCHKVDWLTSLVAWVEHGKTPGG